MILCATPIGNLGDASPRLARMLDEAELIFAEDTRRSRVLLRHLGLGKPLQSYHAGNEAAQGTRLGDLLEDGRTVALITDAGTPAISDPGMSAVAEARRRGATVTVAPGPSAVTAALAVSGLPAERFVFEGFLPRRGHSRQARLAALVQETRTMVLFVAPHHLLEDLAALRATLGDRELTVARELTKAFEEVWWGTLDGAFAEWSNREPQGEFTVVVAGGEGPRPDLETALEDTLRLMDAGTPTGEAVREVATATGVSRNQLYERVINRPR